jgi:hypothetical protein
MKLNKKSQSSTHNAKDFMLSAKPIILRKRLASEVF